MSQFQFDLITIGAGSGGVAASRYAASKGARVAICEAGRVGGTCVLRGCVPKKLYLYAAQFLDAFEDAPGFGWLGVSVPQFDMAALHAAKNAETQRLEGIYRGMLDRAGVTLFNARAQLLDEHTVEVGGQRITGERILIATGGRPSHPPIDGIDLALSSDELLELDQLPQRLLVLGSGYIAVEFAGIFQGFGSRVTMAYRAEQPLRGFDADLRSRLVTGMGQRGVNLVSGFQPVSLARVGDSIVCTAADGRSIEADVVLSALGRTPNVEELGLPGVGVRLADWGGIAVDEASRTTVPHIFAIGDVTDRVNLTPVAIAEGRAFVDSEFGGLPRTIDHSNIATGVFSQPQIGVVGLSEQDALEDGYSITVFESDFRPMKNTLSGRPERSYMKLIVDAETDRVLGAHMIGVDAAEIIQSIAVAVTLGASKRDFDRTMALHPSAAEEFVLMRTPRAG